MIGPAARGHAIKALGKAGRAELFMPPENQMRRHERELMLAQIEIIKALGFWLLQDKEVSGVPDQTSEPDDLSSGPDGQS